MPDTRLDVLCIGNAIVDVIANATDDFLTAEGLVKGSMRLIDAEEAERLYSHMGPAREVSGGCAGNTAAGIAALGGRAGFVGQVAPDQLGQFYRHDLTAAGVEFTTPATDVGVPTARSMILVSPDGQRTMNTFLGAAQHLPSSALDEAQIRSSAAIYLEGYLWDAETPRYAMVRAIELARSAGRKVAFSLSDTFCVDRHRDGFRALIDDGRTQPHGLLSSLNMLIETKGGAEYSGVECAQWMSQIGFHDIRIEALCDVHAAIVGTKN